MTVRIILARTAVALLGRLDGFNEKLGAMRRLSSEPMFRLGIDSLLE